jgi:hypothetical protein
VLLTLTLAALAAVALEPGAARAQAEAEFVDPITITKTADLGFGEIIPANVAGTVTITPTASGSTRSVTQVSFFGTSSFSHAEFDVTGDRGASITITLPASINLTGPGANMLVDVFTSNPTSPTSLGFLGQRTVRVGATLQVGASQTAGSYIGTFNVTIAYQ